MLLKEVISVSRIKLYNTMANPALLYSGENWTITARDARRITAAEMKNSRIHLDVLKQIQNGKRFKYNTIIGQNTGLQKKLVVTCKGSAL